MDLLRRAPFDCLFLAGSEDVVPVLRAELARAARSRLVGSLSLTADAADANVLRATRKAAEVVERGVEVELVDGLAAPAGSKHLRLVCAIA